MATILIAGASRGLGLALADEYLARGETVIGTVRGTGTQLHGRAGNPRLSIETLDVTDPASIAALADHLRGRSVDLLFVNAGVSNGHDETVDGASTEEFVRVMTTNALSPMRVIAALQHLVPPTGTIAVMSSGLGSVTNNDRGGWEVYRASKAALNTLMRSYAARTGDSRRSLAVIAPGWVRTDMGGPAAPLDAVTSMRGVADALAAHAGQPGLRYLDYQGATVPW